MEWLAPQARDRPWVGRPGLLLAGLVLALTPVVYGELDQRPPTPVLVAAATLLVAVVATAFAVGRRRTATPMADLDRPPRRGLGLVAFGCALAHWIATYSVSESVLPWPAGVAVALAPVALGVVVVRRLATTGPYGSDGVRVVVGLVSFFVLLDIVVGLLGRYDMIVAAPLTALVLRRLHRRREVLTARP